MRALVFICLLFVSGAAGGCSRSGDLGGFLAQEVAKCGGHTRTNAALGKLDAKWKFKRDKNGFQASVSGTSFAAVDTFMQQAFGTPKVSTDMNLNGQPQRVWTAVDVGVAINLIGRPDGADIICIRGMRDRGEMFDEMGKPWWKKIRIW